jgi:EAL domain-containing protein (putative c-di-GMP-specific phosphodiesterase class I)/GGDEF domain-containing protein
MNVHSERVMIHRVIENQLVHAVFQPIIDVSVGRLLGYEALSRGPDNTLLHSPEALFQAANQHQMLLEMEQACVQVIVTTWRELGLKGKLFINMSPLMARASFQLTSPFRNVLISEQLTPQQLVIELSEQYPLADVSSMKSVLSNARKEGFEFAIDDLGAGYAGLKTWSLLEPDYVKIDRHFISGINQDVIKRDFVRMILEMGANMQCRVIAEGAETRDEYQTLSGLGVEFIQGYYLGKPARFPVIDLHRLTDPDSGLHRSRLLQGKTRSVVELVQNREPIRPETRLEIVADIFHTQEHLYSLPVCRGSLPLGVVSRADVLGAFAIRFGRDLNARRPVIEFLHSQSIIVDSFSSLDQVSRLITDNQEYDLNLEFIITSGGQYLGMGKPKTLLRRITEQQIRFAQYSNPLTQLPGNVPIYEAIDGLLACGSHFVLAYFDLNSFKPYNDYYGYSQGDEVIRFVAHCITEQVDPVQDFVGHVGGDDFVVIFRSPDWHPRCERMLNHFAAGVSAYYEAADWQRGGIWSDDRRGDRRLFEPLSLAIGVVMPDPGTCASHHAISALAADAKHQAKRLGGNQIFISRRKSGTRLSGVPVGRDAEESKARI